ncbi:MAG: nucleoside triphosphate pyrophosphohydrolase [bacterium]
MGRQKYDIRDLLELMARLRDPESGCPWDLKQNFDTIVPYTLEEVYEVVDAIERQDFAHLSEELGDLLFQVVFYAQLGSEQGLFDFSDVIDSIVSKLLARHPHVFPDGTLDSRREPGSDISDEAIKANWETTKKAERSDKGNTGILDDIPVSLPALQRAEKLQKRASNHGFDWRQVQGVVDKVDEEILELKESIAASDQAGIEEELGDLFFTLVNLSRHLGINSESALRRASSKFESRFRRMEASAEEQGVRFDDFSQAEMEILWNRAKKRGS